MRWRPFLCRLVGHRRHHYPAPKLRHDRRGFMYLGTTMRVRCTRCWATGDDAREPCWWERVRFWWWDLSRRIRESYDPPTDDGLPF